MLAVLSGSNFVEPFANECLLLPRVYCSGKFVLQFRISLWLNLKSHTPALSYLLWRYEGPGASSTGLKMYFFFLTVLRRIMIVWI